MQSVSAAHAVLHVPFVPQASPAVHTWLLGAVPQQTSPPLPLSKQLPLVHWSFCVQIAPAPCFVRHMLIIEQ
jgi:hypothetical protein